MKEAAEFAESTQILMNVSEFTDVSQATDTLISAVQAFGYTAETSMDVVDLLNTIGNNYAISTADLAKSLTKSSASLVAAGGNLAEAAALTATANAIIQDADSVGTALKTTSLRLRGTSVKVLEEEGLDSDGAIESTSKLRSQVLATSGVDILTDTGAYKSTYQILLEIAEVWDQITDDKARAGLLELLAGKRNSSVIAALLQNPEDLKAAYEDAMNAEGSALKENERYLDSIQGKIDQFNNAMQTMWNNTLESDMVKGIIELGTALVKALNAVGPLKVAFVGLFAFLEKKHGLLGKLFEPAEDSLGQLKKYIAQAEKDLVKATEAEKKHSTKRTTSRRLEAQARVERLKQQLPKEYHDVDRLKTSRDALIEKRGLAQQQILLKSGAEEQEKILRQKQAEALKKLKVAEEALFDPNQDFDNSAFLSSAQKELDDINAQLTRTQQIIRDGENAEKQLVEINAQLDKTNKELAEAEIQLSQIDKDYEVSESAAAEMEKRKNAAATNADTVATQGNTAANKANAASNAASTAAESANTTATQEGVATDAAATAATTSKTASTWADVWAEMARSGATGASVLATIQQVLATKLANSALVQHAVALGFATSAEVANMTVTQLLGLAFKGLGASILMAAKAMWTFMTTTPIGWILGIVAVVIGAIAALSAAVKTTEELQEELAELKTEIADVRSEIESLNSELETTQERMAELLAKDSLTFVEEEELAKLQKQNTYLERELELLKQRDKRLQKEAEQKFDKIMGGTWTSHAKVVEREEYLLDENGEYVKKENGEFIKTGNKTLGFQAAELGGDIPDYQKALQDLNKAKEELTKAESSGNEKDINKAQRAVDKAEKKALKLEKKVDDQLDELLTDAEGIDYDLADDQTKKYLDLIYNTVDKVNIMKGGDAAKSTAIERIFNTGELSEVGDTIDGLVEKLAQSPDDKTIIAQIKEQCKLAIPELGQLGLTANDAVDYFTKLGSEAHFNTLEGKIKEVSLAAKNFETLLTGKTFVVDGVDTGLADLFDEEGKIIQTKLSQVFQGTSDQTRAEITKLLENSYDMIADGLDSSEINYLMNRMGLSFSRAILEIEKTNLTNTNLELFPGLKDEISGIIDTFSELTSAVGSVVDAMDMLDQARAEEAYSGSMSLETLEALMKSTDNYADLIEVDETGAIKLATNAQEVLVAQKLEAIKQNAALALKEAELAYEEALHTEQTYSQTGPAQEFMRGLWNEVGGAMAFVGSLWNDLTNGNWDGAWDRAKAARESSITVKETAYAAKAAEASAAVAEAAKNVENAEKMNKIAQGLTPENVRERYSSEEASGGHDSPEDAIDDAFQREMDYWENRIGANQAKYEQIQNEIDILEKRGKIAGEEYYYRQIGFEEERYRLLVQQKAAAKGYLDNLEEGSEEWWEAANTLNSIEGEIDDVRSSIEDLKIAMREVGFKIFEEYDNRVSNLINSLSNVRDILSSEDMFDDEGNFTEAGTAVVGTHLQDIEINKSALNEVNRELNFLLNGGLEEEFDGNEQAYYERITELTEKQHEYTKAIKDSEESVVEMYENQIDAVEEYVDTLIDGYSDYIDSVKEALSAERDLFEFKKNVQKQAKDIAEIERRISSLSGSTNKADIAERRKLEAELYESRESLNDTYYDHAKDSQNEALDAEQQAYQDTMTKMVEGLRTRLEEATTDMDSFLDGVTVAVTMNADTVLKKYQDTGLLLTPELTNPWAEAAKANKTFGDEALAMMNLWIKEDGYFAQFKNTGTTGLKSPFEAGQTAATAFQTSVGTVMSGVLNTIKSNVTSAKTELSNLYKQIQDTETKAANVKVNTNSDESSSGGGNAGGTPAQTTKPKTTATAYLKLGNSLFSASYSAVSKAVAESEAKQAVIQKVYDYYKSKGYDDLWLDKQYGTWNKNVTFTKPKTTPVKSTSNSRQNMMYAKGTTGTKRDEWAITDEPWLGDELVLVPTAQGNLSYMRKGTGVVPADLTANLMEWGQFTPDSMNIGGGVNVNMINNAVNKPEFNFNVDNFLRCDNVSQDSLPELKQFVKTEMNNLIKQMNYAIKGKGGR